jgi:hypothetical protein
MNNTGTLTILVNKTSAVNIASGQQLVIVENHNLDILA